MKHLYTMGFLVVCLCATFSLHAQQPVPVKQHLPVKKAAFGKLPEKIACNTTALQNLFTSQAHARVSMQLNDATMPLLEGTIQARVQEAPGVINMNIQLKEYPGAMLNVSMITNKDQSVTIRGMVIDPNSSDILVLTEKDGQYVFTKQPQQLLMVE